MENCPTWSPSLARQRRKFTPPQAESTASKAGDSEGPDGGAGIICEDTWDESDCLTPRALICGVAVGSCVAAMNVSLGLKTGWGQGGSVTAAVVSYAIFQALKPALPFSPYEVNIAQTCASACGTMVAAGGLSSAVPALYLLGVPRSCATLICFSLAIASLGCLFGVPLRKPMIVEGQYRFPEGTTTYNTIRAMYASGAESASKALALFQWFVASFTFSITKYFLPVPSTVAFPVGPALSPFGFALELDPMLVSIGMMVGPATCASLALGGGFAWGVLAPAAQLMNLCPGPAMAMTGARGFILWPGITLLTVGALAQLVLALVDLVKSMRQGSPGAAEKRPPVEDHPEQVPQAVVRWGLLLASVGAMATMKIAFGLPVWHTAVALGLSTVLSYVAVRCVGETNINPIGGIGKVAQLLFAALAPGDLVANVMHATVAASGASQAGDMSTDFKTGFLLRASPWKQFRAQLVGVPFGAVVSVLVYKLFERAYDIGSITIVLGGLVATLWSRLHPTSFEESNQEVGSGILAGSGVATVIVAILTLSGVPPLWTR
eukprot:gene10394-12293_t